MRSRDHTRSEGGETRAGDGLLRTVVRRAWPWLGPLLVVETLGAVAMLALPAVVGRTIDQVVGAVQEGEVAWATARSSIVVTAALLGGVVLADVVGQLVAGIGTARSTGTLRRELVRHVLAAGPEQTRRTAEGDLVARLVGNTTTTARVVVLVAGIAAAVIPPVGGVVALALIDPWLAVTFVIGMATASGAVRAYLRDNRTATAGYQAAQGAIAGRLVDALAGARTIGAARTTGREVDRVLEPLAELRRHGAATWRHMARLAFTGEPIVMLTQVAVVVVAGLGLDAGRLSAGELLAASRYAVMAAGIGDMINELAGLSRARAGAQRVADVLATPVATYGDQPLPPGPGRLELRGVRAGPPEAPVLDGLDLVVPGGAVVALVGRSGAGKSLTAALAGRLCDPTAGEVRLDGMALDRLDRRSLRRAVTYAFERPALLGGTIAESIGFGVDPLSSERVRSAARAARAGDLIGRLPDGYDAVLAETPMSGGELQRIGLARALAQDARVLILDDATSSLDTATEAEIVGVLTARTTTCTRLIVTHRMATAACADLVLWLDGGQIRASGTHRDLWSDPAYRAVFRPEPAVGEASPRPPAPAPSPAAGPGIPRGTPVTAGSATSPGNGRP